VATGYADKRLASAAAGVSSSGGQEGSEAAAAGAAGEGGGIRVVAWWSEDGEKEESARVKDKTSEVCGWVLFVMIRWNIGKSRGREGGRKGERHIGRKGEGVWRGGVQRVASRRFVWRSASSARDAALPIR
jgi:hypothetical protein